MKKVYILLTILLGVHLLLLFNLKFTAWPEMLSYPYLRNNGYLLYKDMIHPYPPVLTIALSIAYKLFGYKLIVLKIFTWLIILVNDILILSLVKKIAKKYFFAFCSLIFYIVTQPFLEGNQLWFDLAIVPAVLFGTLMFLNKKYFLSGLGFGIACLTKQTAGLFLVLSTLYIVLSERNIKKIFLFLLGPFILVLLLVLRLITEGALSGFLNWTLIYPLTYWSSFPGYVQMVLTNRQLAILALLIIPVITVLLNRKFLLFTLYFLLSLMTVYPRFSFFHFQLGIAFLSILFGIMISKFFRGRFFYVLCPLYFVLVVMFIAKPAIKDWGKEVRFWSSEEENFVEIIKKNTNKDDLIYLIGSHSGLYVLSDRLPPKPWTDNFVWYLEVPGIQEDIINKWENNKPKIVFTSTPQEGNWYDLGTYRPQKIVDWIKKEEINQLILGD